MKRKGFLGGIFAMALILVLTLVLSVGSVSAAEPTIVDSGNCGANGDNITWTLDDAGTLTISGEGEMGKFQYSGDYPWLNRMNEIKAVRIEDGVTNIGGGAFDNGVPITAVSIPDSVTAIGEFAFSNCINLKSLTIPDSVTDIGVRAFYKCWGLTAMEIPKSVTKIHNRAFDSCSGLTGIQVADENPNYASMDGVLFDKEFAALLACPEGKKGSYRIPDSVTSIEESAFYGCSGLTSVKIPEGVTSIEPSTFANCVGLTSVAIPKGVTGIGRCAFDSCSRLTSVTIPEGVTDIGRAAFSRCTSLKSVKNPEGVTSIGSEAFWGCSKLTDVTIPDSVTSIGFSAFSGCTSLRSMRIPKNVAAIEENTFYGCTGLTSVTILEGVTKIGESAFSGCSGLTAVKIPGSVVSIGKSAFDGCSSLTSVTISEGTASIGDSAFNECRNLTSVAIPDSVTSIGEYVFGDCRSLISATIPEGVTEIKRGTFYWCTSLTSVSIPDSVTSIGDSAFYLCTSLASAEIPSSVSSIGTNAFMSCRSLTSVTIPVGVTEIGESTFQWCFGLTSVTIPEGVVSIGWGAFYSCSGMTSVKIPSSVTSIGVSAFNHCDSLTDVYYSGTAADWAKIAIDEESNGSLLNAAMHCRPAAPAVKPSYMGASGKPYIKWNAVANASQYEVYRATTKSGTYTLLGTTTATHYTDNKAGSGYTYYYKVKALAANGAESDYSAVVAGICHCAKPTVKATYMGASGKPYLRWNAVANASQYEVYRATTKSGTYTLLGTTTATHYTDNKAGSGYTYYYKVRAISKVKSTANSVFSVPVAGICHCAKPTVKATYMGATGKPYIKWNAVANASKYEVYRATSKDGTYTLLGTTTATNYTDNKAGTGYTYYYKVRAISKVKSSANSAFSTVVTGICHCARPTVKITTSAGKPRLTWNAVAGASKYEVYRATSKNGTYTKMYTTTRTSYTNTSAKAGTTYYYKVKAVSKVKSSANSVFSTVVSIRVR